MSILCFKFFKLPVITLSQILLSISDQFATICEFKEVKIILNKDTSLNGGSQRSPRPFHHFHWSQVQLQVYQYTKQETLEKWVGPKILQGFPQIVACEAVAKGVAIIAIGVAIIAPWLQLAFSDLN